MTQTLYAGTAWMQLCPTPEHLETTFRGRVTPREVTLQYPVGKPCLGAHPKQIIKGTRATFFERSGYNWRAVVKCGQAFPLLFYSCLMF